MNSLLSFRCLGVLKFDYKLLSDKSCYMPWQISKPEHLQSPLWMVGGCACRRMIDWMYYFTHQWHSILYQLALARPHNVLHFWKNTACILHSMYKEHSQLEATNQLKVACKAGLIWQIILTIVLNSTVTKGELWMTHHLGIEREKEQTIAVPWENCYNSTAMSDPICCSNRYM